PLLRRPPSSTPFPSTTLFRSTSGVAGSVRFGFDDTATYRLDDSAPFLMSEPVAGATGAGAAPFSWTMPTGTLRVTAIGYTERGGDRKSTRLNSSHDQISYAVF